VISMWADRMNYMRWNGQASLIHCCKPDESRRFTAECHG
jgi:hypothetical protein